MYLLEDDDVGFAVSYLDDMLSVSDKVLACPSHSVNSPIAPHDKSMICLRQNESRSVMTLISTNKTSDVITFQPCFC